MRVKVLHGLPDVHPSQLTDSVLFLGDNMKEVRKFIDSRQGNYAGEFKLKPYQRLVYHGNGVFIPHYFAYDIVMAAIKAEVHRNSALSEQG